MKKTIAVFLAVLIALSCIPSALAYGQFNDFPGSGPTQPHEHIWVLIDEGNPWGCTDPIRDYYGCSCGEVMEVTRPGPGHKWSEETVVTSPSCTESGTGSHICSVCGEAERYDIPAAGHQWGSWYTIVSPTTESGGTEERDCIVCGAAEYRYTGPLPGSTEPSPTEPRPTDPKPTDPLPAELPEEDDGPVPVPYPIPDGKKPVLLLVANQTSSAKGAYGFGETVSFNWTLTNIGQTGCTVDSMIVRLSSNLSAPASRITSYPDGAGAYLAPFGGSTSGELTLQLPLIPDQEGDSCAFLGIQGLGISDDEDKEPVLSNIVVNAFPLAEPSLDTWVPEEDPLPDDIIFVTKSITSTPADPAGYAAGEAIGYSVTVTNQGDMPLTNVYVNDSQVGTLFRGITLDAGETVTSEYDYILTEYDIASGEVDSGHFIITNSVDVTADIPDVPVVPGDPSNPDDPDNPDNPDVPSVPGGGPDVPDDPGVPGKPTGPVTGTDTIIVPVLPTDRNVAMQIEKQVISTAPQPGGYPVNSTITYQVTVYNISDETLTGVEIGDSLFSDMLTVGLTMDPHTMITYTYDYTVSPDDLAAGCVINSAYTVGYSASLGHWVGASTPDVVTPVVDLDGLSVVKSVISTPMAKYYQAGEWVRYMITVTNNTGTELHDIRLYDYMIGSGFIAHISFLGIGESKDLIVSYQVTKADVLNGSVTNVVCAEGEDYYGNSTSAISNTVVVETGVSQKTLQVLKIETSVPADGVYHLGETIDYLITLCNPNAEAIGEIQVYDLIDKGTEYLGGLEKLPAGDRYAFEFHHTVTAEDVERGYVMDTALASYEGGSAYSNTVTSPTGDDSPVPTPTPTPTPGPGPVPGPLKPITPLEGLGDDCCKRILTGLGDDSASFTVHVCSLHTAADTEASDLLATGTSWRKVRAVWERAINKMLDICFDAADESDARAVIMSENLLFWSMIDAREQMLQAMGKTDAEAAQEMNRLLRLYCVDLCCELHTAPEDRPDSYSGSYAELAPAGTNLCGRTETQDGYLQTLCQSHSEAERMVRSLISDADTPKALRTAWTKAQRLEQIQLDAITNTVYRNAEPGARSLIAADRNAFGGWLVNHIRFLTLLYGDSYQVPEIISKAIADRVVDLCS